MMPEPTVTFETKCWERDWRWILQTSYLENMISHNDHPFAVRALFINNVKNPREVIRAAEQQVQRGVLTEFHLVEDHAAEALHWFDITRESFGLGYYYSIAELVALYLARTDYLLHFAGDVILTGSTHWIPEALALMRSDPKTVCCNPRWTPDELQVAGESHSRTNTFYLGQGFSDQMYLVPVRTFRKRIYSETHPASSRYPAYGGNLFERRVDAWMRNHGHLRATSRVALYHHHGFQFHDAPE